MALNRCSACAVLRYKQVNMNWFGFCPLSLSTPFFKLEDRKKNTPVCRAVPAGDRCFAGAFGVFVQRQNH